MEGVDDNNNNDNALLLHKNETCDLVCRCRHDDDDYDEVDDHKQNDNNEKEEVIKLKFLTNPHGLWIEKYAEDFMKVFNPGSSSSDSDNSEIDDSTSSSSSSSNSIISRFSAELLNKRIEIEVIDVSFTDLSDNIINEAESKIGLYDGFITPPSVSGSIVQHNGWADLTSYIQETTAKTNDWADIMLGYRKYIAQYENTIIMYPLDGDSLSMFYRKDILEYYNLTIPRTWEEYNYVAKRTHNQIYKDGTKLIGSCIGRVNNCAASYWANLVLSSITQTLGPWEGHLFDTTNMKPLTGDALEYAIQILEEQVQYGPMDEFEQCIENNFQLNHGNCVLTYNWGDSFKRYLSIDKTVLSDGKLGIGPTPGSSKVLDRETYKLVPCNEQRCKHGIKYNDIGYVNKAPYLAFGGWSCAVNNYTSDIKKLAAMNFCSFASSHSKSGVIPNATGDIFNGQDPYRLSQLDLNEYINMGYEKEVANEFIQTMLSNLQSENVVTDIRFPTATRINNVLDIELYNYLNQTKYNTSLSLLSAKAKKKERQRVVQSITEQWEDIISTYDQQGTTEITILEAYQRLRGVYAPKIQFNQINNVRIYGYLLVGIILFCSILFALWSYIYRRTHVVRASQPFFLIMICYGTMILGSTIIPLSIDDSIASNKVCSQACMTTPWLLALGFTVVFSALFAKIRRVLLIYKNAKRFKRVTVSEKDVLLPFIIMFTLNVTLLLLWTIMDPLLWIRTSITGTDGLSSYGSCKSIGSSWQYFLGLISALNLLAVILANIQAYLARHVGTEFGESKYIAMAMGSIMQIGFVGIPLAFLVNQNPPARYFLWSCMIFIVCMSILVLIFIPKLKAWWEKTINNKKKGGGGTGMMNNNNAINGNNNNGNQFRNTTTSNGLKFGVDHFTISSPSITDFEAANNNNNNLDNNVVPIDQIDERLLHLVSLMKQNGIYAPDKLLHDAGLSKDSLQQLMPNTTTTTNSILNTAAQQQQQLIIPEAQTSMIGNYCSSIVLDSIIEDDDNEDNHNNSNPNNMNHHHHQHQQNNHDEYLDEEDTTCLESTASF